MPAETSRADFDAKAGVILIKNVATKKYLNSLTGVNILACQGRTREADGWPSTFLRVLLLSLSALLTGFFPLLAKHR